MHAREKVDLVLDLYRRGFNQSEIARRVDISRGTIKDWVHGKIPDFDRAPGTCAVCSASPELLPRGTYVYLLGLYLGDGCISAAPRGVFKLRITCCDAYPVLMQLCEDAMAAVLPNKVGRVQRIGCTEVYSNSKHWPCLFPQHGPGPKHLRTIELAGWQQELVDADPRPLIKGLIHSDGTRVLNHVPGTDYGPYPRYHFTSASDDIRKIFTDACDAIDVLWRQNNARNISVARRASVAVLDEFIGPKT